MLAGDPHSDAFEVKNKLWLFESPFKMTNNDIISFLKNLLSFQRYSSFCSNTNNVTNRLNTKINCKFRIFRQILKQKKTISGQSGVGVPQNVKSP